MNLFKLGTVFSTKTQDNYQNKKINSDKHGEAIFRLRQEQDPLIISKIIMRITDGIYDFSDL